MNDDTLNDHQFECVDGNTLLLGQQYKLVQNKFRGV